jgi:hypothetical protein
VPSELAGTAALWVALVAAVTIAVRARPAAARLRAAAAPLALAIAAQAAHFAEEALTGFARAFPARLGLAAWSPRFFVAFNLAWLAVWIAALAAARAGRLTVLAAAAAWFLAIAAIANGVAHPLLALSGGGYFPGLVTAIPLAVAGGWLATRLATRAPVAR